MALGENLSQTTTIARTFSRPFPPGVPGELLRDDYTGIVYRWSPSGSQWIPYSNTEKDFTFYVNWTTGNDANVGDAASPLKTYGQAIQRLPRKIKHQVVIELQDNAGAPVTYDEMVTVEDFSIDNNNAGLTTIGKDRALMALAASPANTGTFKTWTINPSPGWVVNEHVGHFVLFTAGPHAGTVAWILANTANTLTLSYRPFTFEGPYGTADAGEIREITTILQNVSGGPFFIIGTIRFKNILGSEDSRNNGYGVRFEKVHLIGDTFLNFCIETQEHCCLTFYRCRVDDYVFTMGGGGGEFMFQESLGWPTKNRTDAKWFASTPANIGMNVSLFASGMIGGGIVNSWHNGYDFSAAFGNYIYDPINPARTAKRFFDIRGGVNRMSNFSLDMNSLGVPIYVGGGSNGELQINSAEVMRSTTSGIQCVSTGQGHMHIRIDETLTPGDPTSDFSNNPEYGIDASGAVLLDFYNAVKSTTTNGIAGTRIREGAKGGYFGLAANIPTMSGPGPAFDKVELGTRTPRQIIPYNTIATDLQDLSRYKYAGT